MLYDRTVCPKFSDAVNQFDTIASERIDLARSYLVFWIFNRKNCYTQIVAVAGACCTKKLLQFLWNFGWGCEAEARRVVPSKVRGNMALDTIY